MMPQFYFRRIKGNGSRFFGDLAYLTLGHKEKLGLRINKTPDKPGAGHAINVNM
jgi:hypothetical protein